MTDQTKYRLYGRRQDKPLTARQQNLMDHALAPLGLDVEAISQQGMAAISRQDRPIWLELGFGGGEHLAWQAAQHPDVMCLGAEPFINGVAKLLVHIEEQNLTNVRVLHGDGRPLLEALPDQCLSRLFILHPDPWPKKRHFKRRIISPVLLTEAARLLKPGSVFRLASDIPDYIRWTLMQVQSHNRQKAKSQGGMLKSGQFRWLATQKQDWTERPMDWPQTRYEAKALREGRTPAYLQFERM